MAQEQRDDGVAWDIIAQAVAAFDEWMLDDDYDAFGALNRIMGRMKKRASYYRPGLGSTGPVPTNPDS